MGVSRLTLPFPSVLKISISTLIKEGGRKRNSSPCAYHPPPVQRELLLAALNLVPPHVKIRGLVSIDHHCGQEGQLLLSHHSLGYWPRALHPQWRGSRCQHQLQTEPGMLTRGSWTPRFGPSPIPTPYFASQVLSHPSPPHSLGQAPSHPEAS